MVAMIFLMAEVMRWWWRRSKLSWCRSITLLPFFVCRICYVFYYEWCNATYGTVLQLNVDVLIPTIIDGNLLLATH